MARPSFRPRVPAEERERALVELAEPLHVDVGELARAVQPAEAAIDREAEVLVVAREREGERLVGEQAIDRRQIGGRSVTARGVDENGALAEEHVGLAGEQTL